MTSRAIHEYTDEENSHFLRQILQFLTAQKMQPTPRNFNLCYDYVTGNNKALTAAINSLLQNKKPITPETSTTLYNSFIFDSSYKAFDKVNQDIESLMDSMSTSIEKTSQQASSAGKDFEDQADSISSVKNAEDLKQAISQAAAGAQDFAVMSKSLQSELDAAKQEMEQLKNELIVAKESASIDALTGLLNRGAFDKALNSLVTGSNSPNACLSMLDLDHFKNVNDTHGHLIGDNVLKITASLLKKYARPQHHVARYGGEELAIIMPDTSIEQAVEISNQIREALANSKLKKKNGSEPIGQITVSIGVSRLQQTDTVEDLIMRADKALYEAKDTGRNKVVTETLH